MIDHDRSGFLALPPYRRSCGRAITMTGIRALMCAAMACCASTSAPVVEAKAPIINAATSCRQELRDDGSTFTRIVLEELTEAMHRASQRQPLEAPHLIGAYDLYIATAFASLLDTFPQTQAVLREVLAQRAPEQPTAIVEAVPKQLSHVVDKRDPRLNAPSGKHTVNDATLVQ